PAAFIRRAPIRVPEPWHARRLRNLFPGTFSHPAARQRLGVVFQWRTDRRGVCPCPFRLVEISAPHGLEIGDDSPGAALSFRAANYLVPARDKESTSAPMI